MKRHRHHLTRRQFLASAAAGSAVAAAGVSLRPPSAAAEDAQPDRPIAVEAAKGNLSDHEAMFYRKLPEGKVRCGICPRLCEVSDRERGWCGVRENHAGAYKTLVYGKVCSAGIDPIEKKPLYHYLPGSSAVSVATAGCNMECKFCQNWEISQVRPEQVPSTDLPPDRLVAVAKSRKAETLAFTYSEPTVFYEYAHDAARAARAAGIGSAIISNGYMQPKPFEQLCKHLTAVKVDFKGYSEKFYRTICRAELAPVLETLKLARKIGIHLEIVVLVIPTLNDDADELKGMCGWIVENLGPDVPLHFSRFSPMYRLKNLPPTPVATLTKAHKIATDAGVRYAYIGNVPMSPANHTHCHKCRKLLIKRVGYLIKENHITDGAACPDCKTTIPGVWSSQQAFAERS